MECNGWIKEDTVKFFQLGLSDQQTQLPNLIGAVLNTPATQWAGPWSRQAELEKVVRETVASPILRLNSRQETARWAGSFGVVWLGHRGHILGITTNTTDEVGQDNHHLEAIAAVNAIYQLYVARAGHRKPLSCASAQRYLYKNGLLDCQHVGSYYSRKDRFAIGVHGAEVPWEQRRQWLPGLQPDSPQSCANAIAGALNDVFARHVATRIDRSWGRCYESEFLARLRISF